jgi:thiol-disulfide isomerase/thioredoxin
LRFALLALLCLAGCTHERQARADCVGPADCRPPFAAQALDGSQLGEEAVSGKVLLVNFWATWCAPCQRELPALQAVYSRHKLDGFTILGVVTGDGAPDDSVRRFAAARSVGYPLVRGGPDLERRFGLGDALPTSYLYDRHGHLVRRWEGDIRERDLEALVERTLAE